MMEYSPDIVPLRRAHFQIFVLGRTPAAILVEQQLRRACRRVRGPVTIEVIDLFEHPEIAEERDIVATPMVLRLHPTPQVRVVGDLSDPAALVAAFDLNDTADDSQGDTP